jgi:tRNA (adenine57-N1/adenine58-N1)-methyltransferase
MSVFPLTVKSGGQLHTKDGVWNHDQMIGKPYGHKVWCHARESFLLIIHYPGASTHEGTWMQAYSSTGFYAFVLHPTPELWTLCLPHRTQIIYTPDIR